MSAEQSILADSIKKVHQQLRRDVNNKAPEVVESIWNAHVADVSKLNEYAKSMRQLAEHHWAEKPHGHTRLTWCYETIKDYYFGNESSGLQRKCARDQRKQTVTYTCESCQIRIQQGTTKPRVLDVGSCYNAFSVYNEFETTAIDIAPGDDSVHRFDILCAPQPPLICTHSFDAIVFSLVLDYLPTCRQRLSACLIAQQLLTCLGLLLIIEPDSTLRNNRQKSWRQALDSIGYALVSYVKVTNLYCMAFRKILQPTTIDEATHEKLAQLFHIPQDTIIENDEETVKREPVHFDKDLLDELPFSFD